MERTLAEMRKKRKAEEEDKNESRIYMKNYE
jgi:hypothetical protein